MSDVPRLELLTRAGCHLCVVAAETLQRVAGEAGIVAVERDVDTDPDLQALAAASLARYKVPTSVHFLPSLPHSLTGKVSRARLRELGLTGNGPGLDTDEEVGVAGD